MSSVSRMPLRMLKAPDTVRGFLLAGLALVGMVLFQSCATTGRVSTVEHPLQTPVFVSRDGVLHYRVPVGWFRTGNGSDAEKTRKTIWLMRDDFAATITVSEVNVDAEARKQIDREGLRRAADVTMRLATEKTTRRMTRPPAPLVLENAEFVSYELADPVTHDSLRVVLLDATRKLYEVTALVAGEKKLVTTKETYAAQASFLRHLRW